jgi:hypothetical protein
MNFTFRKGATMEAIMAYYGPNVRFKCDGREWLNG